MNIKGKRILSNGVIAGYIKQSDGSWKWRFIGHSNSKGGVCNRSMSYNQCEQLI